MSNSNQWWFHWIIRTLQINSLRFDVSLHTIKKKKKESIPLDHVITSYRPLLFKGLYISLASVFVFLLLCVDISQRAKPSCLMLQIRNTLRRLWRISARLGCQIKKNEEVEAQSIGIHPTVSKCRLSVLASLQYEINQIQQRPILLFFFVYPGKFNWNEPQTACSRRFHRRQSVSDMHSYITQQSTRKVP